jgi:chemosensory pili system protein ChpC
MYALKLDQADKKMDVIALPLEADFLLVPDVMVAEICEPRQLKFITDGPNWLMGEINWRGRSMPLVCFEAMNSADARRPDKVQRVAVIASVSKHGYLPYYALVLAADPTVKTIGRRSLAVHEGRPRGRAESLSVECDGIAAGIPNINWIEQHLLGYILHHK